METAATDGRTTGYMSKERQLLKRLAREFTEREVLPVANELDPQRGIIPDTLVEKLGNMGYFGILIPEEYGGAGLGVFEYCLVAEELSRGWMSVASLIARGNGFYRSIPGSGEERRRKIEQMARGEYLGALAMSEPDAGSDIAAIKCRARREGDEWVINGAKYWCTFADGADFIQVIVRTEAEEDDKRHRGLSSIAIEKPRGELPAGVAGSPIPKIGYFGWKTWELTFDNVRVPVQDAERERRGSAFYGMTKALESARAHTAARSIGLAQGALEQAIAYAKERIQFRRPIADFQAIRFKIATMATEIEAARQLLYSVCHRIDLGGAGYTTLYPVERYWRDARLTKIFEGTSEIMQRIISDELLGKPTRPG